MAQLSWAANNKGQTATLNISANKVVLSQKHGSTEYRGKVRIRHAGMQLYAQRASTKGKTNGKPQRVRAWGNPLTVTNKTTKGAVYIKAQQADYLTSKSLLVLSGKVSIDYAGDHFGSERIYYHPPSGRLWSGDSAQPVRAQIKLKKEKRTAP
ncbi:MAG: hypothetical protein IME93_05020 [Proteobacteria bacterium]|nr:hypothetical protein [Pseudomonadota bacterium]